MGSFDSQLISSYRLPTDTRSISYRFRARQKRIHPSDQNTMTNTVVEAIASSSAKNDELSTLAAEHRRLGWGVADILTF